MVVALGSFMVTRLSRPVNSHARWHLMSSWCRTWSSRQPQFAKVSFARACHKETLLNSLLSLDRGPTATPEARAEIIELITNLEVHCAHPNPNEEEAFGARWRMVYTTNSEFRSLLSLAGLPLVEGLELHHSIDRAASTLETTATISLPGSSCTVSLHATFHLQSPKRIGLQFLQSKPQRGSNFQVTTRTTSEHADAAIAAVGGVLENLIDSSSVAMDLISEMLPEVGSNQGKSKPLVLENTKPRADTWLITSYLDEDLCIRRGDGNSLFVFVRDPLHLQKWAGGNTRRHTHDTPGGQSQNHED